MSGDEIDLQEIHDELEEQPDNDEEKPVLALVGVFVGLLPPAYLGYPYVAIFTAIVLGAIGYAIEEHPDRCRYVIRAVREVIG